MASAAQAFSRIDAGSIAAIFEGGSNEKKQPVVQCVQIKPIASNQPGQPNAERYRVIFSDTKNYIQTMLATAANHYITSGSMKLNCVVKLLGYQSNNVKGKKILIVTDVEVLEELGIHDKLGNPQPLEVKQEEESKPATVPSNNFYGQQKQEPSRSLPSHNKPPSSSAHANIYPIEALSPYSHKWTIKARCTSKSDIKTWHNVKGEGKLFSVNFLDDSGEIRATGFNDQCDQLYELIQEGQVYYISSPCRVQIAKKQFSNLSNDYELTFERDTQVEKAEEEGGVPQVKFSFTQISDLQTVEKDTTIDIIGVLKEVGETNQITSKTTSKPYDKRELTLVDSTGYSVRLTIWGKTASSFDTAPDSVVAFKGVKVSDFGGRSLSLLSSGSMTASPDIPEAHKLKGWYSTQGHSESFATHANVTSTVAGGASGSRDPFKTIAQCKDEGLGMDSEKADFFSLKASTQYIKQDNFCYPACSSEGCNKKVVEIDPGQWRCERCDKNHPKPQYRYIMSVNVSDHTGQIWLSCFDESARVIMGISADELMEIKEVDEAKFSSYFTDANCRIWNWKVKAKMDSFQDQQRVRYQVSSAGALNYTMEAIKLTELIKQYNLGD